MLWLFDPNSNLVASRADRRASCPSMRPRHHRGNAHQGVLYERIGRVSGVSHFSKTNCQLRDWEGMKIQSISRSQHVRKNISDMFHSTLGVGAGSGVWHRQRVPDLSAWRVWKHQVLSSCSSHGRHWIRVNTVTAWKLAARIPGMKYE